MTILIVTAVVILAKGNAVNLFNVVDFADKWLVEQR